MGFAAIAPAGRKLIGPRTAIGPLARDLGVANQSTSYGPCSSGRLAAISHHSLLDYAVASARHRAGFRAFVRMLSSRASSSAPSEKPPPSGSSNPQPSAKGFDDTMLKKMKVFTSSPSNHFEKYKPLKREVLYGDTEETTVVQHSFQASLASALAVFLRHRKCKLAFAFPSDLTMWRVNAFSELEIAAGTIMRVSTEYHLNRDIMYFAFLSEYCLREFGGQVPAKFRRLLERMKSCTENKGYSLSVDPSLIASQYWSSAFLDTFHLIVHVMPKQERDRFLKSLKVHCQGWHRDMVKNPLLRCFVLYSQADGTIANRDINCPLAFLECLRHAISHPLDYLELMRKLGLQDYTKADLHLLLQEHGGDKLMSDIWNLLPIRHRKYLAFERYICRERSSCCPIPLACARRRISEEPLPLDPVTIAQLKKISDKRVVHESLYDENTVLKNWKILYAENRISAVEGFWKMLSSIGRYSIWLCNFDKDLECNKHEAVNVLCGMLQKMSACRKYSLGKMAVMGTQNGPLRMQGFWVFPGNEVPQFLMDIHGMECCKWNKGDASSEKDRVLVNSILNESPVDDPIIASRLL